MSDDDLKSRVRRIEELVSHIWMVRTFLKHSEEAGEDEELRAVYRGLYDFMMALGGPVAGAGDQAYLKMAKKKFRKLRESTGLLAEIQPEISSHTNFQMAVASLQVVTREVGELLERDHPADRPSGETS